MHKYLVFLLLLFVVSCGGDGLNGLDLQPPITVSTPTQGATISAQGTLTVQFDETLASVTLGGMLAQAGKAVLETRSVSGDTVVISPVGDWPEGSAQTLHVQVQDRYGNTSEVQLLVNVDTTAPMLLSSPEPVLAPDGSITLQYGEAFVDWQLAGDLAAQAQASQQDGNVLVIAPATRWSGGQSRSLSVTVTDAVGNSRTSEWTLQVPLTFENFQAADVVIGQADMTSTDYRNGLSMPDEKSLSSGYNNVFLWQNYLYVNDYSDNRMLVFDGVPTENHASATAVLGQINFNDRVDSTGASNFGGPINATANNEQFFIGDYDNNRVLVYSAQPTAGPGTADFVLGQPDFNSRDRNCTASGLSSLEGIYATDNHLIVADYSNNRVLIWNLPITASGQPADRVLGQSSFTNCVGNDADQDGTSDVASAQTMERPAGVWSDGTRLVTLERTNNRVLIWNSFPTENFQAADVVLGQSTFSNTTALDDDQDGTSDANATARTLNFPYEGIDSNGVQLCVADSGNNRVLIWNQFPTQNFEPADIVLGQKDMTLNTRDDDNGDGIADANPTARTLGNPGGCFFADNKLLVSEINNDRVLIYTSK
jgi:hypothetical protein